MSYKDLPEMLVIQCKDSRFRGSREFYQKIIQAAADGWVVWDDPPPRLAHCIGFLPTVVLVKPEVNSPEVIPKVEEAPKVVLEVPPEVVPEEETSTVEEAPEEEIVLEEPPTEEAPKVETPEEVSL